MKKTEAQVIREMRPPNFSPVGELEWARLCPRPDWLPKREKHTHAQSLGIRYERRVHERMYQLYPDHYLDSPWFIYREKGSSKNRYCQPDGLLFDIAQGRIVIVEVKFKHCAMAWWQLNSGYLPIVRAAFAPHGEFDISLCEVCRWYDPELTMPAMPRLCRDVALSPLGRFNVHIFRA